MTTEQWDVTFDLALAEDLPREEFADELVDLLSDRDGVVSVLRSNLVVSVTVESGDFFAAVEDGFDRVRNALEKIEFPVNAGSIIGVHAKPSALVEASLDVPTFPEMMGVAEVAERLDVSKQRVNELRRAGKLPAPIADLRAGPVWPRPAVERWLAGWERRPGRPRGIVDRSGSRREEMADAKGMKGNRARNANGRLRDTRDDKQMGTLEKQYGRDFEVRSDMQVGTFLKREGVASVSELLDSDLGKKGRRPRK